MFSEALVLNCDVLARLGGVTEDEVLLMKEDLTPAVSETGGKVL